MLTYRMLKYCAALHETDMIDWSGGAAEWKYAEEPFQCWWTQGDLAAPDDGQPS